LHVRPYFDRGQLSTIDAQVVHRWQNELAGRVGHDLLLACRSVLNRILEAATVNRRIPINPVRLVPAPPPVDPDVILGHMRRRALTPEEFGRLVACTSWLYRDHFVTQVGTGLRSGELLGLQPAWVLLDQARLEVVDVRYDAGKYGSGYRNRPKTRASIRAVRLRPRWRRRSRPSWMVARRTGGCSAVLAAATASAGASGRACRPATTAAPTARRSSRPGSPGWTCAGRATCARPTPPC
jgi:integrase